MQCDEKQILSVPRQKHTFAAAFLLSFSSVYRLRY